MLTLSVAPDREEYVAKQDVLLALTIQNTGPDPLEIPDPAAPTASQPVYVITGPSFPAGKTVSARSAIQEQTGAPVAAPEPPSITILSGGVWEGQAPLGQLFGPLLPGAYRIHVEFAWQGSRVQSADTRLLVKPAEPVSFHVGQGLRPNERAEGRLVFLNRAGAGTTLMAGRFTEARPDIGEMRTAAPVAQFTTGPAATDVTAVWRNIPFFGELIQWTVWREGREVKAISDAGTEALSLTLPADPVAVVRPALKLKGESVEALVLGGDQRLYLCLFPTDFNPKSSPRIQWHSQLPAAPDGVTAALAPEGDNRRHVAFAAAKGSGVEIYHSSYRDATPLAAFQSVHVPNVQVVKNIPPALMVESTGMVRVTVVVMANDAKSYMAIETRFKDSGPDGPPEVLALGGIEHPIVGGRVLYVDKAGKFQHREIAVVTNEGAKQIALMRTQSGAWKELPPRVALPMLLVPGQGSCYVLCFDAMRGFYFEAM